MHPALSDCYTDERRIKMTLLKNVQARIIKA